MPYLASIVVALWLGSLVHLILSVSVLFSRFPTLQSDVAIEGAPAIFNATERYDLALAIASVLIVTIWRVGSRLRILNWAIGLLGVAALLAILQIAVITPRLNEISPHIGRVRTNTERVTFDRLHHLSSFEYVAQTVLVLTAALLLPAAIKQSAADPRAALPLETAQGFPLA